MSANYCNHCGARLKSNAHFCQKCGKEIDSALAGGKETRTSQKNTNPAENQIKPKKPTPPVPPTQFVPPATPPPPAAPQPRIPRTVYIPTQPERAPQSGIPDFYSSDNLADLDSSRAKAERRRKIILWSGSLLVILCCAMLLGGYWLYQNGDALVAGIFSSEKESATPDETATTSEATRTSEATSEPSATPTPSRPQTWLVMMYEDADDEVLEKDMYIDLNEAERVGSTDRVTIVAQMDRYQGGFSEDGNWTEARRYLLTQDGDLKSILSQPVANMGELDSGDMYSLVDFGVWAITTYPADRYVLIFSDHGSGWAGSLYDDVPREYSHFTLNQVDKALGEIIRQTGISQFELVGFDACLMAQLEVLSGLAPYARYAVASEEVEPALGWAYTDFLTSLVNNPDMSGAQLGEAIVSSYIAKDSRVTDDQARQEYMVDHEYTDMLSAEQLAERLMDDVSLSAVDLQALGEVHAALNELVPILTRADQSAVARARTYAQAYTSVFTKGLPKSYLDLIHLFRQLAEQTGDAGLQAAVDRLQNAVKSAVVAEMHGPLLPGSSGISIYFPNSELYRKTSDPAEEKQYIPYATRFAAASLWDDFLAYHYTSRPVDPASANVSVVSPGAPADPDNLAIAPSGGGPIVAPGSEAITIQSVTVSKQTFSKQETVSIAADIVGKNIGYIYYVIMYQDPDSQDYMMADLGFVTSDNTYEIDGVYYPDWGSEGEVSIEIEWEPTIFYVSNGKQEEFALFRPEQYGQTSADTYYTLQGYYTSSGSGERVETAIYFNGEGKMTSVWGNYGSESGGAWRQITPTQGDTFTIVQSWFSTKTNPQGEEYSVEAGVIEFTGTAFNWVEYYPWPGSYMLGFVVQDLDGNLTYNLTPVEITD